MPMNRLCPNSENPRRTPKVNQMAKEMNETTVTMTLTYNGIETTLTRVISNVNLEQGIDSFSKQVALLSSLSGGLAKPE